MMTTSKPLIGITTDLKEKVFSIEPSYAQSITSYDGIPFLIPSIPDDESFLDNTASKLNGLLIPGSRDMDPKFYNENPHPKIKPMSIERTEFEFRLLERMLKKNKPVFGICGGMQLINVFFGGSLYQDIESLINNPLCHENGSEHDVILTDNTLLKKIIGTPRFRVKSYHHQSVNALGKGLKISAHSPDDVIEGIESTESYVMGIQWHPELDETRVSEIIFKDFISRCYS